ncbi:hypothetical protein IX332_001108 [Porphyromonas levii]|uniref:DUF1735 and LamG domain-containing protein n=1 Tax=Porphyromonas levii TaxID=28114 RepID=UPI001B8B5F26|nr:DUF1735 and LamG domain-containing protein [Porphyromonas levii]MBR8729784.1 hypothetical protein [Porphyromonas levii]
MKTIYNVLGAALLSIGLLPSCNMADGIGNDSDNAVYMGNANKEGVLAVLASDAQGASVAVTPKLASITNEPVEVTVEVDQEALRKHNKDNNLELSSIAPEDVIFTNSDGQNARGKISATIKPGEMLTSIGVAIENLDPAKYPYSGKYAIPVSLVSSSSKLKLLSKPRTTIITLNRKITTTVIKINSTGGGISLKPIEPLKEEPSEWTFQMSVMYPNLNIGNLTTAYMGGAATGEFYTRISSNSGIQIKNGRDGDDTWTQKPLNVNEWLNISYVYRKKSINSGTLSVYVDGELHKSFTTTTLYPKLGNSDGGWNIGNGNWSNVYLREVRLWNRALSEAEIKDRLYMPQGVDAPGLLMYVPFNRKSLEKKNEAGKYMDETGKWTVSLPESLKYEFVDHVVFPATKLEIETPLNKGVEEGRDS